MATKPINKTTVIAGSYWGGAACSGARARYGHAARSNLNANNSSRSYTRQGLNSQIVLSQLYPIA